MAAIDDEIAAVKAHPIFLRSERKANVAFDKVRNAAYRRAQAMEEKEAARHKAAMDKIQAVRDKGHEDAVAASYRVEHDAWEAALVAIRKGR